MAITWKLTITQKLKYTDTVELRHSSLDRITEFVNFLESNFDTDSLQYKIESVEEDEYEQL